MYGSIHTHFESRFDTANDMTEMCQNFIKAGAKKVAVTEHGVISSYEDLKDVVHHIKDDAKKEEKEIPDFDIIPGVEGYFGENRSHLILVAKDYEGYVSLCRIISESNENLDKKGNPIISLDNLKRNVKKGHLICTSACIAGPFGRLFGLEKYNLEKKCNKLYEELLKANYFELYRSVDNYEKLTTAYKENKVTKKEKAEAASIFKKTNDRSALDAVEEKERIAAKIAEALEAQKSEYEKNNKKLLALQKNGLKIKYNHYTEHVEALKELNNHYAEHTETLKELNKNMSSGQANEEAKLLFSEFHDLFGDDFYFEIQNHGLMQEKELYNKVIRFAYEVGHPKFIASNDIHVGVQKSDPNYENALLKRNIIEFTRFNTYKDPSEDDREYVIKDDDELREELLKSIQDVQINGEFHSKEEIINSAIQNIEHSLSECKIEFPQHENHYPKFCDDENAMFEKLVREGLKERFPNGFPDEKLYNERLEYELNIVKTMGYAGYHLIVADYLKYGRLLGYLPSQEEIDNAPLSVEELDAYITRKGYPRVGYNIGPGRGSGAGSLCCYGLGITDIDPIPYNLLYERFLNPERVSMPDVDSDFRTDIREKVVEYCKARYGADCICQIMTKAYVADKGGLRLAARYLGAKYFKDGIQNNTIDIDALLKKAGTTSFKKEPEIPLEEANDVEINESSDEEELDKFLEDLGYKHNNAQMKTAFNVYMKDWYNVADKLSKQYDELNGNLPEEEFLTEQEKEIVKISSLMNGVFVNYGQHAAGTIISGDRLSDIIPLMWNEKKKNLETQCTMAQAEAKGLLKMDFLGLQNLDIITEIMRHPSIGEMDNLLQDYVKRDEMLKDPAIYRDIFCTGLTQGVFQFESPGMKKMLMDFKPECFEDIILLVAAYRPGPMDYIPEIIDSKWYQKNPEKYLLEHHGQKPKKTINIENAVLKEILEPTYGCPIYQEQIMQICQKCAGFSLGEADNVRRAMSKKKEYLLVGYKKAFIYGDDIVNDKGETIHIPGCQKACGMTEKEATLLFEQLMPFAKYGFNKSHATAYAMVAMFTAYQKKYHTADFFRVSLNYTKELKEIPAFVSEMGAFGLTLKGPSILGSKNLFSVEDDGKSIRFGFKKIKSFSEQNIIPSTCLEEFLEMNPDISMKMIEKYVRLGLFQECWKEDIQMRRVHGNRHECLKWLEKNGDLFVKRNTQQNKADELDSALKDISLKISAYTSQLDSLETNSKEILNQLSDEEKPHFAEALKEYNKIKKSYENWKAKLEETEGMLQQNMLEDTANGMVAKETIEECLENRKYEIEMMSIPFDVEDSMRRVEEADNRRTFDDLKVREPFIDETGKRIDRYRIPAVVLSCIGPKKTQKGNIYYEVQLMDRNRNTITRRFDEPVSRLDGIFSLTIDGCKFFNNYANQASDIKARPMSNKFNRDHKAFYTSKTSSEEKINTIKKNKEEVKRKTIYIGGKLKQSLIEAPIAQSKDIKSNHCIDDECFDVERN